MKAFLFALFGIFIVLLLIFRSVTQPLLVLIAIPFGIIGVVLAFKLHGQPLGFFAMIGTVGLAGVVVNDSIVMVDFMNRLIKKLGTYTQQELREKIVEGAGERLVAVLLTTITTIAGVLPTVYGIGGSNPMIKPLTMALAYGLLFGTLITLILLPNIFLIEKDVSAFLKKISLRLKKTKIS
jgi:multidrug efflux pump subunit AcrB